MQTIYSYEQTRETLALLKILALGLGQVETGRMQTLPEVIEKIRARRQAIGSWMRK